MKKRALLILEESRQRQELLDQLNQTVQYFKDNSANLTKGDDFDYATRAAIMDEVITCITAFRSIENQLLSVRLGLSYTNTAYTAFDFIVKVPTPQFIDMRAVQSYYTQKIAELQAAMALEAAEGSFIDDGLGQGTNDATTKQPVGNASNIVYTKTATWTTAEDDIITSLGVIQSTLMGDVPNVS
jgi:hypothetical protein